MMSSLLHYFRPFLYSAKFQYFFSITLAGCRCIRLAYLSQLSPAEEFPKIHAMSEKLDAS